ncbi:MAG: hypothetical protein ABIC95_03700 [archaeon]
MTKKSKQERSRNALFILVAAFVGIIIGLILVTIFFSPDPETVDGMLDHIDEDSDTRYMYNGFSFVLIDGLWYTKIKNPVDGNEYVLPLHFGPKDVQDVMIEGDVEGFLSQVKAGATEGNIGRTFVTFNPTEERLGYTALANSELSASLIQVMHFKVFPGCDRNATGCEGATIVHCGDTDKPVIYLNDTINYPDAPQGPRIVVEDNCLTVYGSEYDLVKAVNRLLYKWHGIM